MGDNIYSFVEFVAVAEVRQNRETVLGSLFAPEELPEMAPKPPGSIAGIVAAKRALSRLVETRLPGCHILPQEWVMGHNSRGAPILKKVGAGRTDIRKEIDFRNILISISHSAETAVAIAALREKIDE